MHDPWQMSASDPKRLGTAITDRRGVLGVTQEEFAARIGMPVKTLQRIEAGKITRPRPKTLGLLDKGAEWPDGHARRINDGEIDPSEQSNEPPPPPPTDPEPLTMEWFVFLRERLPRKQFDQVVHYVKIAQETIAERDGSTG
jgi:transcriptional regulator with XRE-family HTH domain